MDVYEESVKLHGELKGKLKIVSKAQIKNTKDLSLLYTPGVARISEKIHKNNNFSYDFTGIGNTVAVISDGSAVLGLGNIGAAASLPVMEGKCAILAEFAGVNAFPIVLNTQDRDGIIKIVKAISPSFGAINLEDIAAPNCFYIEDKLQDIGIPVFHDDQHGTAIVVLAALINALKVVKKDKPIKIVISGAGAAGQAITNLLLSSDLMINDLILMDSKGAIYEGRKNLNEYKQKISKKTNKNKSNGDLENIISEADVFVGVSKPNIFKPDFVKRMTSNPIILAMANPIPEIMPQIAKKAGAAIVATGRSDFPNQVNNALVFPGLLKGALDGRIVKITVEMKLSAANAIAKLVDNPKSDNIVPSIFDKRLVKTVAHAVNRNK